MEKNPSLSLLIAHNYVASTATSVYVGSAQSLNITFPSDMTLLVCVSQRLMHSILWTDVTWQAVVVIQIEDHEEWVKSCWWLVVGTFQIWPMYANVRLSMAPFIYLRSKLYALNCIEKMKHSTSSPLSLLQPVLQFYHLALAPSPEI